jgi:hypothetical protein
MSNVQLESKLGPIGTRIIYEDDEVRIWDQVMPPGHHLGPHKHECDYAIVCVDGDKVEADTLPGNATGHDGHMEVEVDRGKLFWVRKGGVEEAFNKTDKRFRAILVEMKQDS